MKDHLGETIEFAVDAGAREIGVVEDYSPDGGEIMIRPRGKGVMQVRTPQVEVFQVLPAGTVVAPPAAAAGPEVPKVRWNPQLKVVMDHEDGTIDEEATNQARGELGLEVPWNKGIGKKEAKLAPVFLPGTEPRRVDGE